MEPSDPPPNPPQPATQRRLQLTKIALLVILLGLSVIERRITAWPIVTWPMYGRRTTPFPPPSASGIELRVTMRTGRVHKLTRVDFFPMGRTGIAERAMGYAFNDADPILRDAYRTYLVNVVKRMLRTDELDTVEGWRLEWAVQPLALPPLDKVRPLREIQLGSFSALHYAEASGNER